MEQVKLENRLSRNLASLWAFHDVPGRAADTLKLLRVVQCMLTLMSHDVPCRSSVASILTPS